MAKDKKIADFDLEDAIGELDELLKDAQSIVEDLKTAETVETRNDFVVNVANAEATCKALAIKITEFLSGLGR